MGIDGSIRSPTSGAPVSHICSISSGRPRKLLMYWLTKALHQGIWVVFLYFLLLSSTNLLLCYLKAGKNKSRVTPLSFLALQFLACSVPCAINHPEVFRLPVPLLTTGWSLDCERCFHTGDINSSRHNRALLSLSNLLSNAAKKLQIMAGT